MKLTTPVVAKLTGASERRIRYWAERGLLKPSAKQTGHRLYTFADVVALRTIVALLDGGCSLQHVRKVYRKLRTHLNEQTTDALAALTLLTDGQSIYVVTEKEAREVLSGQIFMRVIQFGPIIAEARKRARTLRFSWTERVRVQGSDYTLEISHDADQDGYTVQCRELPGAIEQGDTTEQAIANGTDAIRSVLDFMKRRGRRGRGAAVAKA